MAEWRASGRSIPLDRPVVMGILNLTPDSFSDGGRVRDVDHALDIALTMAGDGAAIIDVGGESTRPGAVPVSAEEELERILPFLRRATHHLPVPVSVDTRSAKVAHAALDAGAAIVNDVSALAHDPEMGELVAHKGAGVVLMHMRGDPKTMGDLATYGTVAGEVAAELAPAVARARECGIPDDAIVVDPGIGFAKDTEHSIALLGELGPVLALGFPVLVGPSRKRFLGSILGVPPGERVAGTTAACVVAYLGGARIFRVHDVRPVAQALAVAHAIVTAGTGSHRERSEA
ncbi:MAG: dihydropteroate synthase [Gemmatimonadetes bacterium]|nr:dihydropteroate synthase [Gemmatimonadota bacterium]